MPKPTFQSIQLADLSAITGGCHKKSAPPPCPPPQAPPPCPPPQGGAPEISTSVQITGYGGAQ